MQRKIFWNYSTNPYFNKFFHNANKLETIYKICEQILQQIKLTIANKNYESIDRGEGIMKKYKKKERINL